MGGIVKEPWILRIFKIDEENERAFTLGYRKGKEDAKQEYDRKVMRIEERLNAALNLLVFAEPKSYERH